jgi:hypothetical protein
MTGPPADIVPWRATDAGFAFEREVQPVLDRHCVSCHEGAKAAPDLRGGTPLAERKYTFSGNGGANAGKFSTSYANLFPFVRNNGIEGDYHLLSPMEFHFSATELGQLLRKGHYGVELPPDDQPAGHLGRSQPALPRHLGHHCRDQHRRLLLRCATTMRKEFAGVSAIPTARSPRPRPPRTGHLSRPRRGRRSQPGRPAGRGPSHPPTRPTRGPLDLGAGLSIDLVRIPAGAFVMGSTNGHRDEQPVSPVRIAKPFWMAKFEVSNAQFRQLRSAHDSKVMDALSYQFGQRPWSLNADAQPVCRVSFQQAMAFCDWLAKRTGRHVTLPTEAQWEWACRAGSADAYSFGGDQRRLRRLRQPGRPLAQPIRPETAHAGYHGMAPLANPTPLDDWIPKDPTRERRAAARLRPGSATAERLRPLRHARQRGRVDALGLSPYPCTATRRPAPARSGWCAAAPGTTGPSRPRPATARPTSPTSRSSTSGSA